MYATRAHAESVHYVHYTQTTGAFTYANVCVRSALGCAAAVMLPFAVCDIRCTFVFLYT